MAKGSVRKKGKKWYYRFYVEDASGDLVQKEFIHSDVSTTMNVYAHATREAKRTSAKLLDRVAGND
ncbi:MAG: hypothetical protein K2N87_13005 [Eubacterium sp.]|nr:hypothetical protein [Eubacterium sp.]